MQTAYTSWFAGWLLLRLIENKAIMVWYDFVILALLVYFGWKGASRGLISQSAWIIAIVLCFKLSGRLSPSIEPHLPVEPELKPWVAMFVLYIGFCLGAFIGTRMIKDWVDKAKFKDLDHHLGGIFGLALGILISLVVTFFAVSWSATRESVLSSKAGYAATLILDKTDPVLPLFPEWFSDKVSVWIDEYERHLTPIREQLGSEVSSSEITGSDIEDLFRGIDNNSSESGNELDFPELLNGSSNSGDSDSSNGLFDALSNVGVQAAVDRLPPSIREQWGDQIIQQWKSATPEQKQALVQDLSRAFPDEVSGIVNRFLAPQTEQGSGIDIERLREIGEFYGNQEAIVERTVQHLKGVPAHVQKAVLDDWYADVMLEETDPDPGTIINTRMDERILRQLRVSGVSLNTLATDLQNRLRESLQ